MDAVNAHETSEPDETKIGAHPDRPGFAHGAGDRDIEREHFAPGPGSAGLFLTTVDLLYQQRTRAR